MIKITALLVTLTLATYQSCESQNRHKRKQKEGKVYYNIDKFMVARQRIDSLNVAVSNFISADISNDTVLLRTIQCSSFISTSTTIIKATLMEYDFITECSDSLRQSMRDERANERFMDFMITNIDNQCSKMQKVLVRFDVAYGWKHQLQARYELLFQRGGIVIVDRSVAFIELPNAKDIP